MQNDYWIIDVLRDIGDFAGNRGYFRLLAAMETARDEFLKDVEEKGPERATPQILNAQEIAFHQALVPLRKKYGH